MIELTPKHDETKIVGTTIVCVCRGDSVAIAGDGQVSLGHTIVKQTAKKVRRVFNNKAIVGFAGATADAFTLFEKFEGKMENFSGNITRASVELAKEWRKDRVLRRLEALLIVANKDKQLMISGSGDVIESDDGILAIGSGGQYARAAGLALLNKTQLSAKEIATESMKIAASICIYTNDKIIVEEIS